MTPSHDPSVYVWWLASRAAGVTAFVLASVAVVLGLAMAGRVSRRPGMARALRAVHEQVALGALLAIGAHGVLLLGDHWLHPTLAQLVVPFRSSYRPLATGLGIVAAYGAALLGLTFYARRRIGARLWRKAHRLTVVVWALAAVHALTAGSDASTPWMRGVLLVSALPIAVLLAVRLAGGRQRAPAPRRPQPEALA